METNDRQNLDPALIKERLQVAAAHRQDLRSHLLQSGLQPSDVDDAISVAIRKFALKSGPPVEKIFEYLRIAARNAGKDARKRESRRRSTEEKRRVRDVDSQTPLHAALEKEEAVRQREVVIQILRRLPPKHAWLLEQHYLKNKSVIDIAAALGQSRQNVRKQLNIVIENLRRELSQHASPHRK